METERYSTIRTPSIAVEAPETSLFGIRLASEPASGYCQQPSGKLVEEPVCAWWESALSASGSWG